MANLAGRLPHSGEASVLSFSRRSLLKAAGWLGGAAGLLGAEAARARPAGATSQGEPLEGSWMLASQRELLAGTSQRDFLPSTTALTTFDAAGAMLLNSSLFPLYGTAHGAWVRTGEREYDHWWVRLIFDAEGNHIGINKARAHARVDESLDAYSADGVARDFDHDGNVTEARLFSVQATRIKLESIPS